MKCSKTTTSDNFRHRVVAEYRVLFLARAKPFTLVSEWFPRIYTSRPESQTNVIISFFWQEAAISFSSLW